VIGIFLCFFHGKNISQFKKRSGINRKEALAIKKMFKVRYKYDWMLKPEMLH
jgi:hypothetical protein